MTDPITFNPSQSSKIFKPEGLRFTSCVREECLFFHGLTSCPLLKRAKDKSGTQKGTAVHAQLAKDHSPLDDVLKSLGITDLEKNVPLSCYFSLGDEKQQYHLNGTADVVAYCKERRVVIDWKHKERDLLDYADSSVILKDALQLLQYAHMLKTKEKLKYLPWTYIFAIQNKDVQVHRVDLLLNKKMRVHFEGITWSRKISIPRLVIKTPPGEKITKEMSLEEYCKVMGYKLVIK